MSEGKSYRRRKSIKNWRAYNAALKRRYDVTVYIDEGVLEQAPKPTGNRGRPPVHGDALVRLCLTLRCLLRLPLRGTLVTPPRKNAVIRKGDPPHPRHKVIRNRRTAKKRAQWKIRSGYHRRSLAETVMYRFKTAFTDRLMAREIPQQKTEAMIKIQLLNIFRKPAAPAY